VAVEHGNAAVPVYVVPLELEMVTSSIMDDGSSASSSLVPSWLLAESPMTRFLLLQDEQVIAQQLTLIEIEIFQRIDNSELIGNCYWTKPKYRFLSQNVHFLIDRVNQATFWVATSVVIQSTLKNRAKVLAKLISVARCLRDLNNYNGLMGILNGLVLNPVQRLKHSWALLPKKIQDTYNELCELQMPTNSFKVLRDTIKAAGKNVLPYLGTTLQDIFNMHENPDFVSRETSELINFPKHYLITTAIKNLLQYQRTVADREVPLTRNDPVYTLMYELVGLTEKELLALSLEKEPKGSTLKEVEEKEIR